MTTYNFDNTNESPLSDNELIDIAINQMKKEYYLKVKKAFCAGINVYIIAFDGTVLKSETLNRNEGVLDFFGVYKGDIVEFINAIRIVENVKNGL